MLASSSAVMATSGEAFEEEGLASSLRLKGPLTREQLNVLAPEIQSNIQRMMGAHTLEIIPHHDGTPTLVYAVENEHPTNQDEIDARQRVYDTFAARRQTFQALVERQQDVAPAGTPLAEEALRSLGRTFMVFNPSPVSELDKCHAITVHNIGDVKEAAFRHQNLAKRYVLNFENAQDFIARDDQYKPFLEKAQELVLNFDERTYTPPSFQVALQKFMLGFNAAQPQGWDTKDHVPFSREVKVNLPYALVKDLLSPEAQDAADALIKEATDQKTNFNYTLVEISKGMSTSKLNPAFAAMLNQLSYYWVLKINRH